LAAEEWLERRARLGGGAAVTAGQARD
jgi:hypothetical protein